MFNEQKMQEETIAACRALSVAAIEKANSGHPGLPLGAAPMLVELWLNHMKHNPKNPDWFNRDRFVLSAGHGSMLLYSLLYLFGYGLDMEDLKNFRQWSSKTPGHPEFGLTKGVEATTGPLGQGFAMACGMAMVEKHLAAIFNTDEEAVIDHYTYVLASDGDLMEGVSSEAASLAGTLKLGKLIVLYDDNNISIEGSTDLSFTEDVAKRFEAYGWHVLEVSDGNDCSAISRALEEAKAREDRPSLIKVKTTIGYGSPKADTAGVHGSPLGEEAARSTYEFLHWDESEDPFYIPEDLADWLKTKRDELAKFEDSWNEIYDKWQKANPELAENLQMRLNHDYPAFDLDNLAESLEENVATRAASGEVLNKLHELGVPFFGGSADLAPSNKTSMHEENSFSDSCPQGANVHFGVREFAMAAMCNGFALHGGVQAYSATFLVFSDYMKAAMRLSALMQTKQIFILTHDSIGLGEDGPTHQPIEQLSMLRATPGLTVIRPAGSKETAAAWKYALDKNGPTALILTRQAVASKETDANKAMRGAYIVRDPENYEAIIIASGSELELALGAADQLLDQGHPVRVVSMPSMEIFEEQDEEYQESVLPSDKCKRLAVEAAASQPWYHYVGQNGFVISMDRFGASAPAEVLFQQFGFTAESIAEHCLALINKD